MAGFQGDRIVATGAAGTIPPSVVADRGLADVDDLGYNEIRTILN
jgi:hypothetical protein